LKDRGQVRAVRVVDDVQPALSPRLKKSSQPIAAFLSKDAARDLNLMIQLRMI
jgi:hypothetical protein